MDTVIIKKRIQKKTPLSRHNDKSCDCFDPSVPTSLKRCNYRTFPDGWSFVPDAGNAQSRGEIFTPRWIVDKMIVDSGMLPSEAVYENDYSRPLREYISNRINEPAIGTANYLSTILFHKLGYAESLSRPENTSNDSSSLDLVKYQTHLLIAVGSVYANDIDAGNLEVTKRRLLSSGKQKINTSQVADQWSIYLTKWFNQNPDHKKKIGYRRIKPSVQKSLDEAHQHWYKFVKDGHGVIDTAYKSATGERMPNWLYDQCREILDKNIKLFNGIKETDTLDWSNEFFVPGYRDVVWTWWHFEYPREEGWQPLTSEKEVPLMRMILEGQLEKLDGEIEQYAKDHKTGTDGGWSSPAHQKHFNKFKAKQDKIKFSLDDYS
jgi:hypothetical protein